MQTLFTQLNTFLIQTESFWRFEPFHCSADDVEHWQHINSDLDGWLNSLSPEQIMQLKQQPDDLFYHLSQYIQGLAEMIASVHDYITPQPVCLSLSVKENTQESHVLYSGVPGRKIEQIKRLGQKLIRQHQGESWLEWCAGKGYLGRFLATYSDSPVLSFEYQEALCLQGQAEADQRQLAMMFVQGDAFKPSSQKLFKPCQHAVALHACGDLHVRLMQYAAQASVRAMSVAPCCYHLIEAEHYQPLSSLGKQSSLHLTRQELRIPVQETVTGGERVKRHRQQEMSYRLGWDELLKAELGLMAYQPTSSIKKSQLSEGFKAFCLWAAEQKGFLLALDKINFDNYEQQGLVRYWRMEKLSLVQQGFRRLLEMWLVCDKALFIEEQGYQVSVSEFCSREVTPRNLLIHAKQVSAVDESGSIK